MITLILGIFAIVLMLVMGVSKWIIGAVCIAIGIIVLCPLDGYNETKCIAQIPLLRLNSRYILKCEDEMFNLTSVIFAYDNKDTYGLSGVSYEEAKILGRVKIYEDSECTDPILKVFITTPKVESGFCLAPFSDKVEYVFVIPKEEYNIRRCFFKDDEEKSYTKLNQIKKISEAMQKNMEDKEVIMDDEQSSDNSDSRLV